LCNPDQANETGRLECKIERAPEEPRRGATQIKLRGAQRFVFVRGVNENHAGYFIGAKACVYARIQTAKGRTSEDVGWRNTCSFQQLMKIAVNGHARSWEGTRIAPTLAGPVIPTGLCELGHFRLKGLPSETWSGSTGLEDNRRPTLSRAENIETSAANVHRPSDLLEPRAIPPAAYLFINNARNERHRYQKCQTLKSNLQPPAQQGFLPGPVIANALGG